MENIVITLPKDLWNSIKRGEKKIVLRKSIPVKFDNYYSKCYVILKGTRNVVGYFYIDTFHKIQKNSNLIKNLSGLACITEDWILKYYQNRDCITCWHIGKVYDFEWLEYASKLIGSKPNPQAYYYTDINIQSYQDGRNQRKKAVQ